MDIISIHLYGGRDCYFDECARNEQVVEAAAAAAAAAGKQLFLGEYGPISDVRYVSAVLKLQVDAAQVDARSSLRAFTLSAVRWMLLLSPEIPTSRTDFEALFFVCSISVDAAMGVGVCHSSRSARKDPRMRVAWRDRC